MSWRNARPAWSTVDRLCFDGECGRVTPASLVVEQDYKDATLWRVAAWGLSEALGVRAPTADKAKRAAITALRAHLEVVHAAVSEALEQAEKVTP